MPLDRIVGGLKCLEVLELLSDYLDGQLVPEVRGQVEDHVRGCRECAEFGGRFAGAVRSLRQLLGAEEVPPEVVGRLEQRLRRG